MRLNISTKQGSGKKTKLSLPESEKLTATNLLKLFFKKGGEAKKNIIIVGQT